MFRESRDPGSRHAMLIVSPGKGVAMQYRGTTGGASANVAIRAGTAPEWLRMTRRGNTFTGYASDDGITWTTVGAIAIPMAAQASAGLAVTSHDASRLTTAVFDNTAIMRP
jgi:hypothetical protein